MERRGRERELTSVLLVGLVPAPLTRDQLALGFTRLLASVEVRSSRPFSNSGILSSVVSRAKSYPMCKCLRREMRPVDQSVSLLSHAAG